MIGLDYRPSQSGNPASPVALYGLSDTGKVYTIAVNSVNGTPATLVATLGASFDGGQALADFNPVVDALRVIGSNDQNFAVVNSNGGNLDQTAPQSLITYAVGDVQAGKAANLTAGADTTCRSRWHQQRCAQESDRQPLVPASR